jgi:hypothetical protein
MKSVSHTTEHESDTVLTKAKFDAMEGLGAVLKPIYHRMKKEGYNIIDGKVVNYNE